MVFPSFIKKKPCWNLRAIYDVERIDDVIEAEPDGRFDEILLALLPAIESTARIEKSTGTNCLKFAMNTTSHLKRRIALVAVARWTNLAKT